MHRRSESAITSLQQRVSRYHKITHEGCSAETEVKHERAADVETRLKDRIVDGDRQGLEDDLNEALTRAKGCPVLSAGGTVEVAEAIDM